MRLALASLCAAVALAGAAHAALAPQYYEEARRNADSIVVIHISEVDDLPFSRGYGDCTVRGRVAAVERGSRYAANQRIEITVPCKRNNAAVPASGVQWQDVRDLRRYRWGRAWLTPEGELALSQYEILRRYP
jgi:hypothetical protein